MNKSKFVYLESTNNWRRDLTKMSSKSSSNTYHKNKIYNFVKSKASTVRFVDAGLPIKHIRQLSFMFSFLSYT